MITIEEIDDSVNDINQDDDFSEEEEGNIEGYDPYCKVISGSPRKKVKILNEEENMMPASRKRLQALLGKEVHVIAHLYNGFTIEHTGILQSNYSYFYVDFLHFSIKETDTICGNTLEIYNPAFGYQSGMDR